MNGFSSERNVVVSVSCCEKYDNALLSRGCGRNVRMRWSRLVSASVISAMLFGMDSSAGAFTFLTSSAVSLLSSYGSLRKCPCLQCLGVRQGGGLAGSKLSVIER